MIQDVSNILSQALFFIVLQIIYYVFCLNKEQSYRNSSPFVIFVLCTVSILFSMTVSLKQFSGCMFDFRIIPFAIGILYGSPRIGSYLLLVMAAHCLAFGYDEFYETLYIQSFMLAVLSLMSRTFLAQPMRVKIRKVVIACLLYSVFSAIWYFLEYPSPITRSQLAFLGIFTGMLLLSMSITICLTEIFRRNAVYNENLIQQEKLKIVSEIAASVSHEVRNPLTTSRGFIQLLISNPHITGDKRQQYLKLVLEELDRAQSIITDYLSFAKPQTPHMENMDVGDQIQYVVDVLTPYAMLYQVGLQVSVESGVLLAGERTSFRQCLMNLIKNAIEASFRNGQVCIRLRSSGTHAVIEIEDHGVGMSKERIQRLGNPNISTKETGTGIGTMVIYNIVRSLGGRIEVRSEENKGTCFTLKFMMPSVEAK